MKSLTFAAAMLVTAVSFVLGQGEPNDNRKLAAITPALEQSVPVVDTAVSDNVELVASNASTKRNPREANCSNPVVTFTEPVSIEVKNQALVDANEALAKFEQDHGVVATPEEREAYFKQVAEVLPTEMTTETVFDNGPDSPGVITDEEADPTDADTEKLKNKVKQRGCKTRGDTGVQLVSYSAVTYDNSVGWKSCSKTVSFKALNGLTIGKLRLFSEWYNNAYQVPTPSSIGGRATGTAYYLWSTDGDEDLRIARPYYAYSSGVYYAYQNRAWQDFVYKISVGIGGVGGSVTLDSHTLYAAHIIGPGGKCV